jgi:hypothetical protein
MGAHKHALRRAVMVLCTVALSMTPAYADDAGESPLAGTYDVLICQGPCSFDDTANAVVTGTLVLLPHTLTRSEANRIDRSYDPFLSRSEANGCYTLDRVQGRRYNGYANTRGPALTAWSYRENQLHVSLFRSPDSGYEAVMHASEDGLSGIGQSWGAGVAEPKDRSKDYVIARPAGAADIARCRFQQQRRLPLGIGNG